MENKINILFIAGSGRSGSTILNALLGMQDQFVSIGEVQNIWWHIQHYPSCECRKTINNCEFWGPIINDLNLNYFSDFHKTLQNFRWVKNSWKIIFFYLFDKYKWEKYKTAVGAFYQCLSNHIPENVTVVDSSKFFGYYFIVSKLDFVKIKTLHLIRDPRAIGYSWGKNKEVTVNGKILRMKTFSFFRSLVSAIANNYLLAIYGKFQKNSGKLLYENFVINPNVELDLALRKINITMSKELFPVKTNKRTHSISGNINRFTIKEPKILGDFEWHKKLSEFRKYFWGIILAPLLIFWGYKFYQLFPWHNNESTP